MLRSGERVLRVMVGVVLATALLGAPAQADFPYLPRDRGDRHDPSTFRVAPAEVPSNLQNDYKFAATPESSPLSNLLNNRKADELCGVRGASIADAQAVQPAGSCLPAGSPVRTAFNVTTGRPDVAIAVLDSGIDWSRAGAMVALRKKFRLNQGELPAPRVDRASSLDPAVDCGALRARHARATGGDHNPKGHYDVLDQGVFNVLDYACDKRVSVTSRGRHGPAGMLIPEDLIRAFSDRRDQDHNGYRDDIAGWDFVDNDNNAYDDVHYGHGTGEAQDSNGEANTREDLGTCPNCVVVPLRVGESFIADVNRFAQAVLYATDNNVLVVQEALGTLNNSNLAREAVNYAYHHGTVVIASAADEAAEHHNQPGALAHTVLVNSIRPYDETFTAVPRSYLQFNGCTNFSTKIVVSVPSSSCSSEAVGKAAGVAGLIYSAALNARHAGKLRSTPDCHRPSGARCVISANEVRQLIGSGHIGSTLPADAGTGGQSDSVSFAAQPDAKSCTPVPRPDCTDPNVFVFAPDQNAGLVLPLANSRRYPARNGFNEFYGYGRLNAYKAVSAAGDSTIPPEAEIDSPDWFQQLDPGAATIAVRGHTYARGNGYTCQVYVAPGGQPNNALTTARIPGDFKAVGSSFCDGTSPHTGAFDGTLAQLDVTDLRSRFPSPVVGAFDGREPGLAGGQSANGRPNSMPYAFTVRVVVTTTQGTPMTGEDRRQLFLHRDADMLAAFPRELRTDGASSPLLADVNGDNRNELFVGTSDGLVHAFRSNGTELRGWPVHTDPLALHVGQRAFRSRAVSRRHYGAILSAVAAGDLFHDGRVEIVAADNEGKVYAWDSRGRRVFRREANRRYSGNPATSFARQGSRDRVEHGFLAAPVLANLDGSANGRLDIIAAGEDRHLYAWRPDGRAVPGFPVLMVDPSKVKSVDPRTHHVTFDDSKTGKALMQGKIVATPAVADLNDDGKPEIVLGTNEEYRAGAGNEGPLNASDVNTTSLGILGKTGLLKFANGRVYVVKHDGNRSGHPFMPGWPKKLGIVNAELLPDVGEGVDGSPIVGMVPCGSAASQIAIGVSSYAGPGYLFHPDGRSCFGTSGGRDTALATDASVSAAQSDRPVFPALGHPAFARVGPGGSMAFVVPATGLLRAVDVIAPEYQPSQDFLAAYSTRTGQFQTGFPSPVNDLQFLTGPVAGDVIGRGAEAIVGGSASLDLAAINSGGRAASGAWPKLTGDWTAAAPLLGSFGTRDTDGSARRVVVSLTRTGTVAVYRTPAAACSPSSWPRFHHDVANSGSLARDAIAPGRAIGLRVSGRSLRFVAPGGDLLCGRADHYEVVQSKRPITATNFRGARRVTETPAAPGSSQTVGLPGRPGHYIAIRAVDAANNVGALATIARGR